MGINDNEDTGDITFVSTDKVADDFSANVSEQLVLEAKDGKVLKQYTRQEFMDSKDEDKVLSPT